jgi:hypothetical protein
MLTFPTTVPVPPKVPPVTSTAVGSRVPLLRSVEPAFCVNVPALSVAPDAILTVPLFVKVPLLVKVFALTETDPLLVVLPSIVVVPVCVNVPA